MNREKAIARQRKRRRFRVRRALVGTSSRPRLSVFRSHKHIYCQVIDDAGGKTLISTSTRDKDFAGTYGGNRDAAAGIGKRLAEKALAAGVREVRLDRGSYKYHGRVATLAEAAREAGLNL